MFIPGQYSYLDENGNTIVVKYSAGVNGFR